MGLIFSTHYGTIALKVLKMSFMTPSTPWEQKSNPNWENFIYFSDLKVLSVHSRNTGRNGKPPIHTSLCSF